MIEVFDETFMRRLEQLGLIARRARAGRGAGERRSVKHGASLEFADYRDYTPGDDLRRLDWHLYARLERPFIKLFEAEEDQTVYLLLDASGSMDWPEAGGDLNKWNFSRRLAAALGYIALAGGDRLAAAHLSQNRSHVWGPYRSKGYIHTLLQHLAALTAAGPTDLNAALRHLAAGDSARSGRRRRPGLLFLISDFFSPGGYEQGLLALRSAGHEVTVLHLLSPDEIEPMLLGDLRLHDVETDLAQEITIDPGVRRLYRQHFEAWQSDLERYCFSHDINYVRLNTSLNFEAVILSYLRQKGVVR